jgi:hypothetical protein
MEVYLINLYIDICKKEPKKIHKFPITIGPDNVLEHKHHLLILSAKFPMISFLI